SFTFSGVLPPQPRASRAPKTAARAIDENGRTLESMDSPGRRAGGRPLRSAAGPFVACASPARRKISPRATSRAGRPALARRSPPASDDQADRSHEQRRDPDDRGVGAVAESAGAAAGGVVARWRRAAFSAAGPGQAAAALRAGRAAARAG